MKDMLGWTMLLLFVGLVAVSPATGDDSNCSVSLCSVFALNSSINVRTVIFKDTDIGRICWSRHDLNLLIARRIVQDLLPRKIPQDFQAVLKYFTFLLDGVRMRFGKKNLLAMMTALYDAIGGYLYSVVMPILNEAFYAGNVDYKTVSQLHNMLGVIMDCLGTNGNGWAPPCDMSNIPTKVAPLPLKMPRICSPCDPFVIPYLLERANRTDESVESCHFASADSKIQIPFLDDNSYPSAVAIPLKDHPLFSLMSECSVNIIPKYYIMAMRCLSNSPFTNADVLTFNRALHRWIVATVVPHLRDSQRWYPGFGSIMRVVETMNQRGLASTDQIKPDTGEPCAMPPGMLASLPAPGTGGGGGKTGGGSGGLSALTSVLPIWAIVLLAILALLLLIILCLLIHCCVFIIRRRRRGQPECPSCERMNNPFVNMYCGLRKREYSSGEKEEARGGGGGGGGGGKSSRRGGGSRGASKADSTSPGRYKSGKKKGTDSGKSADSMRSTKSPTSSRGSSEHTSTTTARAEERRKTPFTKRFIFRSTDGNPFLERRPSSSR